MLASVIGVGRTKSGELWEKNLVDLAVEAGHAAIQEAEHTPTAIIVGNTLAGSLGDQRNLAAYAADRLRLQNVEIHTVDDDEASGGAAVRLGIALIRAGFHETVLVIGAEKTSDELPDILEGARATALDVNQEAGFGFGPSVASGLAMQSYIEKYNVEKESFYHLARVAHDHGAKNKMAFFSWPLSKEQYRRSPVVADPFTVCDGAPPCDGAAAVVLNAPGLRLGSHVDIVASAGVSARPGMIGTIVDLELDAVKRSTKAALGAAKLDIDEISLFELHDSSSILGALSLEAIGLCEPGCATQLAESGELALDGKHPTWTFGGHKSRGNAPGASGVYQIVEAVLQLRGEAGENQVRGARTAFVQCLGSFGTTAVTHILRKEGY